MLLSLRSTIALCFLFLGLCSAQRNITVNNTSPSITYEGNADDAPLCKINSDGTIASQPGCYNVPSQCTEGASMGQGGTGAASFSFKGSAIFVNSLLDDLSPIYTVTLDGKTTDVDGVRPSGLFICSPLFSQAGLDPNVEHTIRLSVKGASPTRNTSISSSENFFVFSLVSFVYTEASASNASTTPGSNSSPTSSGNTAQTSSPSSAEVHCLSIGLALATAFTMGLFLLS
ncbi:hypothetical protein Hypma_000091 [Hypsizygus marmoreus]|uniref:Uncharacterized protein n=1 Tax=Hypsizygus marmoreus TaxID=39966 RepID=A0A369KC74_HYPMA|nr:hypothetical protein Hypma_000091 [Hypsizygus marmoreus]